MDPSSDTKSRELQAEIDRLAERLGVRPMAVATPTVMDDNLYIFVDADGIYHYAYFERGKLGFDRTGSLDDALYWYCSGIVGRRASRDFGDRKYRFAAEYTELSRYNPEWGKRRIRELAAKFRANKPKDLALLPDIGEPL
jgi:hypothetical protein